MKTVKIILKFKFLTLFSDKIIQCYTESTVYTIITLFLYGIGADRSLTQTIKNFQITLFLYGIGATASVSANETEDSYYIIPIWNWSSLKEYQLIAFY